MISDFYSIFKSPLKISAKKIKNCRNVDERDFRARGPKLPMATKSRILKLECSQATWTFIDHTSNGRSKEISQKQSTLRLLQKLFQKKIEIFYSSKDLKIKIKLFLTELKTLSGIGSAL